MDYIHSITVLLLLVPLSSEAHSDDFTVVPLKRSDESATANDDWLPMPDGKMYHRSCIYHHDKPFELDLSERGDDTSNEDHPHVLPSCEFPAFPIRAPSTTLAAASVETVEGEDGLYGDPHLLDYYSDWSVYAQYVNKDIGSMYSEWKVPPKPKARGPAGQSSVYIFNGLEDGGGVHGKASLILQPVLQFGKSGCILNPLLWGEWHLTSYAVDGNGRAHCGARLKVEEGDIVAGNMTLVDVATNTWRVESVVVKEANGGGKHGVNMAVEGEGGGGRSSVYSAALGSIMIDAAYLTVEGMVIYQCNAYPSGGGTSFVKNLFTSSSDGTTLTPMWEAMVRHTDCQQAVMVDDEKNVVTLKYNSEAKH